MSEFVNSPFVRIVGEGVDIKIGINDIDDIDIAHTAIDLAYTRYKKMNAPSVKMDSASLCDKHGGIGFMSGCALCKESELI